MRAHIAGIAALINAAGIRLYDTDVARPNYNPADWTATWTGEQRAAWELEYGYAIIAAPTFREDPVTIDHTAVGLNDYFQITAVGIDKNQAGWIQEHVLAAVHRKCPVVAGFNTFAKRTASGIFTADRGVTLDGGTHPTYGTDTYRYRATPA